MTIVTELDAGSPKNDSPVDNASKLIGSSRLWFLFVVAFACLTSLWIQRPVLMDSYSIEEDARSLFWWQRLENRELFIDDPLELGNVEQIDAGQIHLIVYTPSPGYSLLFQVASYLIDPILFSKLLVFPLIVASTFYLFRIGTHIGGVGTAVTLCIAFIVFNFASTLEISAIAGLQRSFMFPLLLGLIYYLMEERFQFAAFVIFLSAALYAPTFPLAVVTYVLTLIKRTRRNWPIQIPRTELAYLLIASIFATLVLMPAIKKQLTEPYHATQAEIVDSGERPNLLADPNFREGGRRNLFQVFPLIGRGGIATHVQTVIHIVLLALFALVTWRLQPKSIIVFPTTIKLLFISGLICFAAAWSIALLSGAFVFYLPNRYTRVTISLFLLIYVVVNSPNTFSLIAVTLRRQRRQLFLVTVPLALIAALIAKYGPGAEEHANNALIFRHNGTMLLLLSGVLVFLSTITFLRGKPGEASDHSSAIIGPTRRGWIILGFVFLVAALLYMRALHPSFYVASVRERQLFQFVETLPEDTLLSGSPRSISAIPIFAGRRILFSEQNPHPDQMVMLNAMEAYYSDNTTKIAAFCLEHEVDMIVVNEWDFQEERIASGRYLFEPIDGYLRSTVTTRSHFTLNEIPPDKRVFEAENLFVVDCDDLE